MRVWPRWCALSPTSLRNISTSDLNARNSGSSEANSLITNQISFEASMATLRAWITRFILDSAPVVVTSAALAAQFHPDPVYNALWIGASTYLAMMGAHEKQVFAEEFNKEEVAEEILNSVAFARSAKIALEAAANTTSEEKIRKIARLLRNGSINGLIQDYDVFKEYVRLVDDISPREFFILASLRQHMENFKPFETSRPITQGEEKKVRHLDQSTHNSEPATSRWDLSEEEAFALEPYWENARTQFREELEVSNEAIESYMLRLTRTGCVAPVSLQRYGGNKTIYRPTSLYVSLENYIRRRE